MVENKFMDNVLSELISGDLAKKIAAGMFIFALLFFVTVSGILFYHWKKYEPTNLKMPTFAAVYFIGSLVFITAAAYFLNLFTK